jgi:hypothetical protein
MDVSDNVNVIIESVGMFRTARHAKLETFWNKLWMQVKEV